MLLNNLPIRQVFFSKTKTNTNSAPAWTIASPLAQLISTFRKKADKNFKTIYVMFKNIFDAFR